MDKIGKSNEQILNMFDVNGGKRLSIKGPNGGNNGRNNGGNNGGLNKKEQKFKQDLINKQMLNPSKKTSKILTIF